MWVLAGKWGLDFAGFFKIFPCRLGLLGSGDIDI